MSTVSYAPHQLSPLDNWLGPFDTAALEPGLQIGACGGRALALARAGVGTLVGVNTTSEGLRP